MQDVQLQQLHTDWCRREAFCAVRKLCAGERVIKKKKKRESINTVPDAVHMLGLNLDIGAQEEKEGNKSWFREYASRDYLVDSDQRFRRSKSKCAWVGV